MVLWAELLGCYILVESEFKIVINWPIFYYKNHLVQKSLLI